MNRNIEMSILEASFLRDTLSEAVTTVLGEEAGEALEMLDAMIAHAQQGDIEDVA